MENQRTRIRHPLDKTTLMNTARNSLRANTSLVETMLSSHGGISSQFNSNCSDARLSVPTENSDERESMAFTSDTGVVNSDTTTDASSEQEKEGCREPQTVVANDPEVRQMAEHYEKRKRMAALFVGSVLFELLNLVMVIALILVAAAYFCVLFAFKTLGQIQEMEVIGIWKEKEDVDKNATGKRPCENDDSSNQTRMKPCETSSDTSEDKRAVEDSGREYLSTDKTHPMPEEKTESETNAAGVSTHKLGSRRVKTIQDGSSGLLKGPDPDLRIGSNGSETLDNLGSIVPDRGSGIPNTPDPDLKKAPDGSEAARQLGRTAPERGSGRPSSPESELTLASRSDTDSKSERAPRSLQITGKDNAAEKLHAERRLEHNTRDTLQRSTSKTGKNGPVRSEDKQLQEERRKEVIQDTTATTSMNLKNGPTVDAKLPTIREEDDAFHDHHLANDTEPLRQENTQHHSNTLLEVGSKKTEPAVKRSHDTVARGSGINSPSKKGPHSAKNEEMKAVSLEQNCNNQRTDSETSGTAVTCSLSKSDPKQSSIPRKPHRNTCHHMKLDDKNEQKTKENGARPHTTSLISSKGNNPSLISHKDRKDSPGKDKHKMKTPSLKTGHRSSLGTDASHRAQKASHRKQENPAAMNNGDVLEASNRVSPNQHDSSTCEACKPPPERDKHEEDTDSRREVAPDGCCHKRPPSSTETNKLEEIPSERNDHDPEGAVCTLETAFDGSRSDPIKADVKRTKEFHSRKAGHGSVTDQPTLVNAEESINEGSAIGGILGHQHRNLAALPSSRQDAAAATAEREEEEEAGEENIPELETGLEFDRLESVGTEQERPALNQREYQNTGSQRPQRQASPPAQQACGSVHGTSMSDTLHIRQPAGGGCLLVLESVANPYATTPDQDYEARAVDLDTRGATFPMTADLPRQRGFGREIVGVDRLRIGQNEEDQAWSLSHGHGPGQTPWSFIVSVLRDTHDTDDTRMPCITCGRRPVNTKLLVCRHLVCHECAPFLDGCPNCGAPIIAFIRIYE